MCSDTIYRGSNSQDFLCLSHASWKGLCGRSGEALGYQGVQKCEFTPCLGGYCSFPG